MRGASDHLSVGDRIGFYRVRRGMPQRVLAELVGRTEDWLSKVENGRIALDRLSVIRALADVLDVTIGDLVGEPSLMEWTATSGQQTVPAIRDALTDYRQIAPFLATSATAEPPDLDVLEREVAALWDIYQRSEYGALTRRLPLAIKDAAMAVRHYDGADLIRAQGLFAFVHQVTTLQLTKLGEADLAWLSASRGLAAAQASGDVVTIGSLLRSATHALAADGAYRRAVELADMGIVFLQPGLSAPSPAYLSVYGSLHLVAGLSAARNDDRSTAAEHLAEAAAAARQLGGDANHVWSAFGPTNVTIHRVSAAMELDDVDTAIRLGARLDTSALPAERRVRHAIETARAYEKNRRIDDAIGMLLAAERLAPEQVRYHRLSRMLVLRVVRRARPPRVAVDLGHRMGLLNPA